MKKGVVLVIVIGIFLVIATLSMAALYLMTQQARINEHKIKRMKALSAAKAGMVEIYAKLRAGVSDTDILSQGIDLDGDGNGDTNIHITLGDEGDDPAYPGVRPVTISVDY